MRKNNLSKIILIMSILIVSVLLINQIYINTVLNNYVVYKQEKNYKEYFESLEDNTLKIAIIGDSHPLQAVNPMYLPESYNFAASGKKYGKSYLQLRNVLKDVKIDNILLPIDLHTFSTNYDKEPNWLNDLYIYSRFSSYKELKEVYEKGTNIIIESYFPSISRGVDFTQLVNPPWSSKIIQGFVVNDNDFSQKNEKERYERINEIYDEVFINKSRFSNITLKYFKKTIELSKEEDMNMIFIKYPYSKEYDEIIKKRGLDNEQYYRKIFEIINETVNDYHVLDYHDFFMDMSNSSKYFADADHLNTKGAEILTNKIKYDLEEKGLI